MRPAIIWGFGQLGAALAAAIETSPDFDLCAVVDHDPAAAGRMAAVLPPGRAVPLHADLRGCEGQGPALVFHATTSAPPRVVEQVGAALDLGHSVVSAAEWLFHPWLRYGEEADDLDARARRQGAHVLGCGINPGFCFEALPLLLSRTVHEVRAVTVSRVSNVSGIGPSDFAHLGFGLDPQAFATRVAEGSIEGHMGFPESVAALAERLSLPIDCITDRLAPTFASVPFVLPFRTIRPGEVVGITQEAVGLRGGEAVIRFTLDMFLDPEGHGRTPQETVSISGSRAFDVTVKPAAAPAAGAAAMMVWAAALLTARPPGLASLLDLPLGGNPPFRLQSGPGARSPSGVELPVRSAT